MKKVIKGLVWYKSTELRLFDNAALNLAAQQCDSIVHTFILDPRQFDVSERGHLKTNFVKFKFIMECVNDLESNLCKMGHELCLVFGKPEEELPLVATGYGCQKVFCHDDIAFDECQVLESTSDALAVASIDIEKVVGDGTLYEPKELPFAIKDLGYFTSFRNTVEASDLPIQSPVSMKDCVLGQSLQDCAPLLFEDGHVPSFTPSDSNGSMLLFNGFSKRSSLVDLTLYDLWSSLTSPAPADWSSRGQHVRINMSSEDHADDPRSAIHGMRGGETGAWRRVSHYIRQGIGRVSKYKETRNGMVGLDYSTKLSPYLATGCISARAVHAEIKKFEAETGVADENTYWVTFELLWRDYMRLYVRKWGARVFALGGPQGREGRAKHRWGDNALLVDTWVEGRTGYPFVDANMRELLHTGYMSNRGRQVVASFLVRDLEQDWRHGAEHFEGHLVDFDVCSNYGNWQYSAGVGSDPRDDRYFNIVKQACLYDPDCTFIRLWCPELRALPNAVLHDPRLLTEEMRGELGIDESVLPRPICPLLHGNYAAVRPEAGRRKVSKKSLKKMTSHGDIAGIAAFEDV